MSLCKLLTVGCLWAGLLMGQPVLAAPSYLHIGMVNAQSGPAAGLGHGMLVGARAVFDDVNARGGVHGKQLMLHVADDAYEPERTVEQALSLSYLHPLLTFFGFVGTPTTNAVLPLLNELKLPLVGAFTGALSLREPVQPQVFNIRASYDDETEALVGQLLKSGARRVAVVHQNDGFGLAVLTGTEKALEKRGLQIVGRASFQRNTVAIRLALATMVELQPEAIVVVGPYTPVSAFIRQSRALGLKPIFATVSFVGTEKLVEALGSEAHNVLISQVVPPLNDKAYPLAQECRALLARHGQEKLGYISLEGCISARVLVHALQLAGPDVTSASLMRTLNSMGNLKMGGLDLSFDVDDHQASQQVFLTRLERGRVVAVR